VLPRGSGRRRTSEEVRYEIDLGESLVESGAIVDEIEHVVAPEWCLTPSDRAPRGGVIQTAAIAPFKPSVLHVESTSD
jgi:hypothetical protein